MLTTVCSVFQPFTNLFLTKYCSKIQIFILSIFKRFSFFVSVGQNGEMKSSLDVFACVCTLCATRQYASLSVELILLINILVFSVDYKYYFITFVQI